MDFISHSFEEIIKKGNQMQEFFRKKFKVNINNRFTHFINEYTSMVKTKQLPAEGGESHRRLLYGYKDYTELEIIYDSKIYESAPKEFLQMFGGNIDPNKDSNTRPRDLQFQYSMAAKLKERGFTIRLCEPDFYMYYDKTDYAVAAKRVSSPNKVSERIREAENQIKRSKCQGIIALSIDNLLELPEQIISAGTPGICLYKAEQLLKNLCKTNIKLHDFEDRKVVSAFFIQTAIPAYILNESRFMYANMTFIVPLSDENTDEFMKFKIFADCIYPK